MPFPISSAISATDSTSIRYKGGVTDIFFPARDTPKPRSLSSVIISFVEISAPRSVVTSCGENSIDFNTARILCSSTIEVSSLPAICATTSKSRTRARSVKSDESPFSNRADASLSIPSCVRVRRIETGSKCAASKKTFFVSTVTPESAPPIIPPRASARSSSAITISSAPSTYDFPSRSVSVSPNFAKRGPITFCSEPAIMSQSNAWSGCPNSSMIRLVASTMLLMERIPKTLKRSTSHFGEVPTVTSRTSAPMYRRLFSPASSEMVKECLSFDFGRMSPS